MTDHELDELASALLDGLMTGEEAAAALRDPAVARRVEQMRAAQALVRATPPVDPGRREDVLAAALRAGVPGAPSATPSGAVPPPAPAHPVPAPVTDIDSRRHRPPAPTAGSAAGRRRFDPRWLTAAAVLLVILGLGALVATQGSGDDADSEVSSAAVDDADDDAGRGGEATEESSDSGTAAQAAPDEAPTTTAGPPGNGDAEVSADADAGATAPAGDTVDLGAVDSEDALAARAADQLEARAVRPLSEAESSAPLDTFAAGCEPPDAARPTADRAVVLTGGATLAGERVAVWVTEEGGTRRLLAVDGACALVVDRALPS